MHSQSIYEQKDNHFLKFLFIFFYKIYSQTKYDVKKRQTKRKFYYKANKRCSYKNPKIHKLRLCCEYLLGTPVKHTTVWSAVRVFVAILLAWSYKKNSLYFLERKQITMLFYRNSSRKHIVMACWYNHIFHKDCSNYLLKWSNHW